MADPLAAVDKEPSDLIWIASSIVNVPHRE